MSLWCQMCQLEESSSVITFREQTGTFNSKEWAQDVCIDCAKEREKQAVAGEIWSLQERYYSNGLTYKFYPASQKWCVVDNRGWALIQ